MWFTHSWLCLSSFSLSCNGGLKQHLPAALCLAGWRYASGTKIVFFFSSLPRSVLLLELKYCFDWKSSSQLHLLAKSKEAKQNLLSHSSLDCPAALPQTEIGKVTLMREIPTVNHWLPRLLTHSLKGSNFRFDQYQPKSSQRATQRSGYEGNRQPQGREGILSGQPVQEKLHQQNFISPAVICQHGDSVTV